MPRPVNRQDHRHSQQHNQQQKQPASRLVARRDLLDAGGASSPREREAEAKAKLPKPAPNMEQMVGSQRRLDATGKSARRCDI
jgi:hypothetical protein